MGNGFGEELLKGTEQINDWADARRALPPREVQRELRFALEELKEFFDAISTPEDLLELGDVLFLFISGILTRFFPNGLQAVYELGETLYSVNGLGKGDSGLYRLQSGLESLIDLGNNSNTEKFWNEAKWVLRMLLSVCKYHIPGGGPEQFLNAIDGVIEKNKLNRPLSVYGHPVFELLQQHDKAGLAWLGRLVEVLTKDYRNLVSPDTRKLNPTQAIVFARTMKPFLAVVKQKVFETEGDMNLREWLCPSNGLSSGPLAEVMASLGILELDGNSATQRFLVQTQQTTSAPADQRSRREVGLQLENQGL